MEKTVLVTGGGGFIGRYVAKALANKGCRVIAIGRGRFDKLHLASLGIAQWYERDISRLSLSEIREDFTEVYHCAGSGSVALSIADPYSDFNNNVLTTRDVLEFARERPGVKVVLASSAGVYGATTSLPISVNTILNPVSPYGVNKSICETLCRQYSDHFGVPVAIVRLFSVYGVGLRKQLLWDACHKITNKDVMFFGTGEETRDWIHVEDAARLMVCAADATVSSTRIFNGANGSSVRIREVLQHLAKLLDVNVEIKFSGMSRPGDPIHYEAEVLGSLELGWRPQVSFSDGLAQYARWFKSEVGCHKTQQSVRG
ncbi:NAD-dependent epimerase/dehydratase family protein [Ensifer sp. 22564]|uniref:NAD-dependent epimerase/dehydratase family protein n=1 Tax=Ensifer sp. 22564 TaxID=3453943 RepID=UPI003F85C5B5